MPEHPLGQGQTESHEEDGPVDGVEADDVLADDVHVGGPILFKQLARVPVRVVAEAGDVVGQSVQPDVDYVFGIEIDGYAPRKGSARNAQILQPRL